jgi:hypothetical protein
MTINELIKSGNRAEIEKVLKQIDEIKQKDLDGKLFVIKAFLICKAIAICAIAVILIKYVS